MRVWDNACNAPPALARNYRLNVTSHFNTGAAGSRGRGVDYGAIVGLGQLRAYAETGPCRQFSDYSRKTTNGRKR